MLADIGRPIGYTPRSNLGLAGFERVLIRAGLGPVAGVDEAGRGACAGPLVVAAVVLDRARRRDLAGLADSKLLSAKAREAAYRHIVRIALDWSVVVITVADIDMRGVHACNLTGMRRAIAGLSVRPGFVLTDGFAIRGMGVASLGMWKGDRVAACVAAASIVAKVTRDDIMSRLHAGHPSYGFARHKGYSTRGHMRALALHGPCREHRRSFANVRAVLNAQLPDELAPHAPEGLGDSAELGQPPPGRPTGVREDATGRYPA